MLTSEDIVPKLNARMPQRIFISLLMLLPMALALVNAHRASAASVPGYEYVSPLPDSRLIRAWNGVIFRTGARIDSTTVTQGLLQVVGAQSGPHSGSLALSDDERTLNFVIDAPYTPGETVSATLLSGIRTAGGALIPTFNFVFHVSPQTLTAAPRVFDSMASEFPTTETAPAVALRSDPVSSNALPCAPPANLPGVSLLSSNNPDPGVILLSPFRAGPGVFANDGNLMIVDNRSVPMFWRNFSTRRPLDFRQQPNGLLSYLAGRYAYLLDDTYALVDSIATGNGYPIDGHDFQLLPNGHALLMSYDGQPVRMDTVVAGGNPNAMVEGLVLQELDASRRVVFQWRSWDYIPITDCNSGAVDLLSASIDYVHGNAIELDTDGNWLISSRHLNEITKINRTTGDVMWRMGLNAIGNQFTFPNDTRGFSHQHDIRRQPNGNLTLFDNGNFLAPQYSRALEFDVDEVNKIATVVWSWGTRPTTFGGFMGSVQVRPSGGRLVCWGGNNASSLRISDIHADDSPALELGLSANTWSYRAYRLPWRNRRIEISDDSVDFGAVVTGATAPVLPVVVSNQSATDVVITCVTTTDAAFTTDASVPFTLIPGGSVTLNVTLDTSADRELDEVLYVHSIADSEIVAGSARLIAAVAPAPIPQFGLSPIRPNPVTTQASISFDVPRQRVLTLEVFGVDGRRVATIASGLWNAGHHEVTWDAAGLSSGVYFCKLSTGGQTATRRLAIVK